MGGDDASKEKESEVRVWRGVYVRSVNGSGKVMIESECERG